MMSTVTRWLSKIISKEDGVALPSVLAMLAAGSLLIVPSLNYVATNINATEIGEENFEGMLAADAGVEDALWRIKNDMPASFPFSYQITDINGMTVDVVIEEVTSISGEAVNPPAGHVDWLGLTKLVTYDSGIYNYTLSITNDGNGNVKLEKILIDFPPELAYEVGSTGGGITTDDPTVNGSPITGVTLFWEISVPLPVIPEGATDNHTFQLSGPPDVDGVEGHSFVQASRGDVSTVCDADSHPFWITAQAKDSGNTVVATIRAGVWQGDQLDICGWKVN